MRRRAETIESLEASPRPSLLSYSLLAFVGSGIFLVGYSLATAVYGRTYGFACFGGISCYYIWDKLFFQWWVGFSLLTLGIGTLLFSIVQILSLNRRYSFIALGGAALSIPAILAPTIPRLLRDQNILTTNCYGDPVGCNSIAQTLNFDLTVELSLLAAAVAIFLLSFIYTMKTQSHASAGKELRLDPS